MIDWIGPRQLSRRGVLGMNRRNMAYIGRYNPRTRFPLVDDKLKTKIIADEAGIGVPELLHVVRTQHEIEEIDARLQPLSEFVIKPAQGSGGKGILVIESRHDDEFVRNNHERIALNAIKRHLSNIISGLHSLGGRYDVAIVESLVKVDELFGNVSHEGVPDIRLIVFQGYPVMGMLRLATTASDGKANLHQGAVGVGLDIGTGQSIAAVQNERIIRTHPDTGADLTLLAVPDWRQLLILAAQCFEVTHLGYLGADIVIDRIRGPLLLELNARPGLSIQIANDAGLLPRLRHIEALDISPTSVEDRVDYAMQTFTGMRSTIQTNLREET
ncbi:MAG: alpha-L-glutamate ligase-like protein [Pseudomonadales bacterium]|jgi:alpha-L-glutamate ligase-like protein